MAHTLAHTFFVVVLLFPLNSKSNETIIEFLGLVSRFITGSDAMEEYGRERVLNQLNSKCSSDNDCIILGQELQF